MPLHGVKNTRVIGGLCKLGNSVVGVGAKGGQRNVGLTSIV